MIKGPFALFFGGTNVVLEKFENEPPTDIAMFSSITFWAALHLFLMSFKRFQKKEMEYGARLRQQRVLGSRPGKSCARATVILIVVFLHFRGVWGIYGQA